jgi:hypothetical protein
MGGDRNSARSTYCSEYTEKLFNVPNSHYYRGVKFIQTETHWQGTHDFSLSAIEFFVVLRMSSPNTNNLSDILSKIPFFIDNQILPFV